MTGCIRHNKRWRSGKWNTNDDDIPARVEQDQPTGDGQERQKELPSDGHQQRRHEEGGDQGLDDSPWELDDAEAEDADDGQEEVLSVVEGPGVIPKGADSICRVERSLQLREVRAGRLAAAHPGANLSPHPIEARDRRPAQRLWAGIETGEHFRC